MKVLLLLILIGALNWGLVGIGMFMGGKDLNVVHMLVGQWPTAEAVIYVLVGLAALFKIVFCMTGCGFGMCSCNKGSDCDKGACCGAKGCCKACEGHCDGKCGCHNGKMA